MMMPFGGTAESGDAVLQSRFLAVRLASLELADPLSAEDQQVQSMPDASPVKWHLAHVTWFFETFLLKPLMHDYEVFDSAYAYLFNSYYEAIGARHPRAARGLLTRPSLEDVLNYRAYVDAAMLRLLGTSLDYSTRELIELGLAHEEQHQELILMDVLNLFATSPLKPPYRSRKAIRGYQIRATRAQLGWWWSDRYFRWNCWVGARDGGFASTTKLHDTKRF